MTQGYKICPACQNHAPLHAPFCANCGHQYQTQFHHSQAVNQTQAFSGPLLSHQAPVSPAKPGFLTPRDATEWKVAAFWLWLLLALSILAAYAGLRVLGVDLVVLLVFGLIATACGVGLRRLYVYVNYEGRSPLLTFFCVIGLVTVFILTTEYREAMAAKDPPPQATPRSDPM